MELVTAVTAVLLRPQDAAFLPADAPVAAMPSLAPAAAFARVPRLYHQLEVGRVQELQQGAQAESIQQVSSSGVRVLLGYMLGC